MNAMLNSVNHDDEDLQDILRASERFVVVQDGPNEAVIKLHSDFDDSATHLHTIDSVLLLLHQSLENGLSVTLTRSVS